MNKTSYMSKEQREKCGLNKQKSLEPPPLGMSEKEFP